MPNYNMLNMHFGDTEILGNTSARRDYVDRLHTLVNLPFAEQLQKLSIPMTDDERALCRTKHEVLSIMFLHDASKVKLDKSLTDLSNLFAHADHLASSSFQGFRYWDVSHVTNMSFMFKDRYLYDADFRFWNISNVTDFSYMFHNAIMPKVAFKWDIPESANTEHMYPPTYQPG